MILGHQNYLNHKFFFSLVSLAVCKAPRPVTFIPMSCMAVSLKLIVFPFMLGSTRNRPRAYFVSWPTRVQRQADHILD